MSEDLRGKVGLVVGASRGIGAATAHHLARHGVSLVLSSRDRGALDLVVDEIRRNGGAATAVTGDAGEPETHERAVHEAQERYGRLDIAFNNAGESHAMNPIAELTRDDLERALRGSLYGTFFALQSEIRAMLPRGGGAIVNMSSTAGLQGARRLSAYAAAKHAVIGLTRSAALEYASAKIRINVVAPGPVMNDRIAAANDEQREQIARAVPMQRIGTPDEIAAVVAWLCSDASSFVTGSVISADGGRLAGFYLREPEDDHR